MHPTTTTLLLAGLIAPLHALYLPYSNPRICAGIVGCGDRQPQLTAPLWLNKPTNTVGNPDKFDKPVDTPFISNKDLKSQDQPSQQPKDELKPPPYQAKQGGKRERRAAAPLRFAGPPKNEEEAARRHRMEMAMGGSAPVGRGPRPGCKGTPEVCNPQGEVHMAAPQALQGGRPVAAKREALKRLPRPAPLARARSMSALK